MGKTPFFLFFKKCHFEKKNKNHFLNQSVFYFRERLLKTPTNHARNFSSESQYGNSVRMNIWYNRKTSDQSHAFGMKDELFDLGFSPTTGTGKLALLPTTLCCSILKTTFQPRSWIVRKVVSPFTPKIC